MASIHMEEYVYQSEHVMNRPPSPSAQAPREEYYEVRGAALMRIRIGSIAEVGLGFVCVIAGAVTLMVIHGPESPALINAAAPVWVGAFELVPGILGIQVKRFGNPDRRNTGMDKQKYYMVAHFCLSMSGGVLGIIMIVFAMMSIGMCEEVECTILDTVKIMAGIHTSIAILMIILGTALTCHMCYLFDAFGFEETPRYGSR